MEAKPKPTRRSYCTYISETGRCLRNRVEGEELCLYHAQPCTICLEVKDDSTSGKKFTLPCSHRLHMNCLSGMIKLECPNCRTPAINLPLDIKRKIEENGSKYKRETEEEFYRELVEENQRDTYTRLPPHMELILALKYIAQLGIPAFLIPNTVTLELDDESPLPAPGSIFQNAVKRIITMIQQDVTIEATEDDTDDREIEEQGDDGIVADGEEDFAFEGNDLRIVHTVRTVPLRGSSGRRNSNLFLRANFVIRDIPDVTQEDLINLGVGEDISDNE